MWKLWLITSGIFFILEIFTTGFLIFWLGIAALISLLISFFVSNVVIQTVIFVISSCILMLCTRPLVNKILKTNKTNSTPTNVYRLIGKEGIVVEDIDPLLYTGKVKIDGELWSAVSNEKISKNTKIKVLEIDGVKLKVESININNMIS